MDNRHALAGPPSAVRMHNADEAGALELERLRRKDERTENALASFAIYLAREVSKDRAVTPILDRFLSIFPEAR